MMCVFGCRWNLVGATSLAVMTFDKPLYRQTGGGGRGREGGGYKDRAGTACSVVVSSTEASLYWPYIGTAVRLLGTPCCDCITAPLEPPPFPTCESCTLKLLHLTRPKYFGHLTAISRVPPELTQHQQCCPP